MPLVCRYIALHVPDLRGAEGFYRQVLGMDVAFREVQRGGEWWTLPTDTGWEDIEAAGVKVGMIALRRNELGHREPGDDEPRDDELVLALFPGTPAPGAVYEICLSLPRTEIDGFVSRVPEGATVVERNDRFVRFDDPFGFRWVLQEPGVAFRSNGEIAGRWLDV